MPNKSLKHRHFVRSTVYKSPFCGFAAQKFPQKANLQTAAELGVRRQEMGY
jgi:hypothetical protein